SSPATAKRSLPSPSWAAPFRPKATRRSCCACSYTAKTPKPPSTHPAGESTPAAPSPSNQASNPTSSTASANSATTSSPPPAASAARRSSCATPTAATSPPATPERTDRRWGTDPFLRHSSLSNHHARHLLHRPHDRVVPFAGEALLDEGGVKL